MLFLGTYQVKLENLETAMAKRLEWDDVAPESFKIVAEYTVHGKPPPFTGVMIFETSDLSDVNYLIMYFGGTAEWDIRPCSNVLETIEMTRKHLAGG
jgi:hypothetical protein